MLERCSRGQPAIEATKCRFAQQRVEYLGHTLTPEGVCLNDSHDRVLEAVNSERSEEFPGPSKLLLAALKELGNSSTTTNYTY